MKMLLLFSAAAALHAQTMVEAGTLTGATSGAAAASKGVGKSIGGVFTNLDKTLQAGKAAASETIIVRDSAPATATPALPAKTYEDIKKAEAGLAYDDLIERFGPPALEVAGAGGVKKLTYSSKNGSTQIEVKDGKVAAINTTKPQSAVFTLPK
jgi:hypothetical protein